MAGTAKAERARSKASGTAPEKRRYVVSCETVRRILDRSDVADTNLTFACSTKSIMEDLRIAGALDPDMPMDVASDKHYEIRYEWDLDEHPVRGVADSKKPILKEMYIAARCSVAGHRFVLASLPFGQFDENAARVRDLLEICTGYGIRLDTVMLDREFHSTEVMSALDRAGVTYLIPCVSQGYALGAILEYLAGARLRVSDAMITKDRHTFCRYTLVITDRKKLKKKDHAPEEKLIASATGDPGMDVDAYAKRWGIKTQLPAGPEHPDQDAQPEPGCAASGVRPQYGAVRLLGVRLYHAGVDELADGPVRTGHGAVSHGGRATGCAPPRLVKTLAVGSGLVASRTSHPHAPPPIRINLDR